jgi:hypothetical protein
MFYQDEDGNWETDGFVEDEDEDERVDEDAVMWARGTESAPCNK